MSHRSDQHDRSGARKSADYEQGRRDALELLEQREHQVDLDQRIDALEDLVYKRTPSRSAHRDDVGTADETEAQIDALENLVRGKGA